ncbi:unnamed protein product, partial [Pylaiella littoralis]
MSTRRAESIALCLYPSKQASSCSGMGGIEKAVVKSNKINRRQYHTPSSSAPTRVTVLLAGVVPPEAFRSACVTVPPRRPLSLSTEPNLSPNRSPNRSPNQSSEPGGSH